MLEALKSQIDVNWKYRDRQFILNPSTWLNGKRWEDDIVEPNNDLKTNARAVSEPRKNKMQEMEDWNMKILKEIEDEFNEMIKFLTKKFAFCGISNDILTALLVY
jgi:hypothetical protein